MRQPHPRAAPVPRARTCLVIEDSEFDCARLTRILERSKLNLRVQVASTLGRARDLLLRELPALILLDNNLPDGLGADFALEMARTPRWAHIPVIMVSDWPSPFMWEKAERAGVRYVLSKTEFDARYIHASLSERPRATH